VFNRNKHCFQFFPNFSFIVITGKKIITFVVDFLQWRDKDFFFTFKYISVLNVGTTNELQLNYLAMSYTTANKILGYTLYNYS